MTPPEPSPRALECLGAAHAAFTALRRAYAGVLDAVHGLEADDVAGELGYPSTSRLLADHARLDRGEATVLLRHARATHPTVQPSGHATPTALAATAARLAHGEVSDGHVRVIGEAVTRLDAVDHLDTATKAVAEQQLATLACDRTPAALAAAAEEICGRLDADGAVPDDGSVPVDELRLLRRKDGSLHGKFRFLDPVSAEAVHTALRAATPPPSADGDPTATDGPANLNSPDTLGGRPIEQRQAQALRDLCATTLTRGLDVPDTDPTDADPSIDDPRTDEVSTDDPSTDEVSGDQVGLDVRIEFYGPAELCDLVDDRVPATGHIGAGHIGAGHIGAGHRAAATAATPVEDRALADAVAPILDDPQTLDSLIEQTIAALLAQRTTSPQPSMAPPKTPPKTPPASMQAPRARKHAPGNGVEGGERIHLAVTIDWDTLRAQLAADGTGRPGSSGRGRLTGLGHLDSGVKISPETARRMACDAEIIPVVLGSRSEPLDIGRKTRVVSNAIRRGVIVRDRHCSFPGCRRRPRSCDCHHIEHWIVDGETKIENLCLLCSAHHTLIHHSQWSITMVDGLPWFIPPAWLDPLQRPRNNRPWRTDPAPPAPPDIPA